MKYGVYIIEDDIEICSLLKTYIEKYGFKASSVKEYDKIIEEINDFKPQVILIDINLPKFDGFYWCRKIRQNLKMPIIFISARDSGMDQVMALESGADDYITKPFEIDVVIAKIKSHIRRAYGDYAQRLTERIVEVGKLKLFPERFEAEYDDKRVILTKKEAVLLEELMKKYPKVVSRDYLMEKIWDDIDFVEENTLNVNIRRIRKKLQELGIENGVETIRGAGYRLQLKS